MLDGAKFCKWFFGRLCLAKNKKIGDLSERQRGQISIWTQSDNIRHLQKFAIVSLKAILKNANLG